MKRGGRSRPECLSPPGLLCDLHRVWRDLLDLREDDLDDAVYQFGLGLVTFDFHG